jgi:hypothetical protein
MSYQWVWRLVHHEVSVRAWIGDPPDETVPPAVPPQELPDSEPWDPPPGPFPPNPDLDPDPNPPNPPSPHNHPDPDDPRTPGKYWCWSPQGGYLNVCAEIGDREYLFACVHGTVSSSVGLWYNIVDRNRFSISAYIDELPESPEPTTVAHKFAWFMSAEIVAGPGAEAGPRAFWW